MESLEQTTTQNTLNSSLPLKKEHLKAQEVKLQAYFLIVLVLRNSQLINKNELYPL